MELVPDDAVIIVVDGKRRRFTMDEVSYAGSAASEPAPKTEKSEQPDANRMRGRNAGSVGTEDNGKARPFITVHAGEARLKLTVAEPGTTSHLRSGEAMGIGSAGWRRVVAVHSFSYTSICTAPCEASLPAGTHRLARSTTDSRPIEPEDASGEECVDGMSVGYGCPRPADWRLVRVRN
jgi:hypothetical protein